MLRIYILFAFLNLWCFCDSENLYGQDNYGNFNTGWRFTLDSSITETDIPHKDKKWRSLELPHDWSIEFPFDTVNTDGATGYLPGGIGWYQKHFTWEDSDTLKDISIYFDGVYNNSKVWINGHFLGERPYGYVPFHYEVTDYLNKGNIDNIITVKVDRSRYIDSRWYPGSGIYRDVSLIKSEQVDIPIWGVFISTPEVSEEKAIVNINVEINNTTNHAVNDYKLQIVLKNDTGQVVAQKMTLLSNINAESQERYDICTTIDLPKLWDINTPFLYTAELNMFNGERPTSKRKETFGIRTIRFDSQNGFFLNDRNIKIKGVCLHHDGGLVGAAVPDAIWRRRLQVLKDGGCNAIRVSHNPGSEAFLDICDEMGFLVQDEFFDEWDYPKDKRLNQWERHDDYISRGYANEFQQWARKDLEAIILAHRNHPSIIQWSIGNEIEWTYDRTQKATGFFGNINWSGNYFWSIPPYSPAEIKAAYKALPEQAYTIEGTAEKLSRWTKNIDKTRPVIANCILPSASFEAGVTDALDIVGFSYRRVMYDYAHKYYPNKVIMGTENLAQYHEWKAVMERPFVAGTFLWTGIDYMGESHNAWPKKGTSSGLLNTAGFPKPSYYMMKALWTDAPSVYMTTQRLDNSIYSVNTQGKVVEKKKNQWQQALWSWHDVNEYWNYNLSDSIIIEVISNCPEVELFLNETTLGKQSLIDQDDHIYKWFTLYQPGDLKAVGTCGESITSYNILSAAAPAKIDLRIDNKVKKTNGIIHIVAQIADSQGSPVKYEEADITFQVSDGYTILGVDNGSLHTVKEYQTNTIETYQGRALIIVKSENENTSGMLTAEIEGIPISTILLN